MSNALIAFAAGQHIHLSFPQVFDSGVKVEALHNGGGAWLMMIADQLYYLSKGFICWFARGN